MKTNKIVPCIWFGHKNLIEILQYYQDIFSNEFVYDSIISLGDTPDGYGEMYEIEFYEHKYIFMNTVTAHHLLNDTISFIINCTEQSEIDKFWDYFTKDGEESQCGWCIDKFGLRFQIIPENLRELMIGEEGWKILMRQIKDRSKDGPQSNRNYD